jgi:hypothetical protein
MLKLALTLDARDDERWGSTEGPCWRRGHAHSLALRVGNGSECDPVRRWALAGAAGMLTRWRFGLVTDLNAIQFADGPLLALRACSLAGASGWHQFRMNEFVYFSDLCVFPPWREISPPHHVHSRRAG